MLSILMNRRQRPNNWPATVTKTASLNGAATGEVKELPYRYSIATRLGKSFGSFIMPLGSEVMRQRDKDVLLRPLGEGSLTARGSRGPGGAIW